MVIQNSRLIRYITANFGSLRGLRRLPFGVYYLLCAFVDGWLFPTGHYNTILIVVLCILPLFAVLAVALIDLYYRRKFGDVEPYSARKAVPFSRAWLWVPTIVGALLVASLSSFQPTAGMGNWLLLLGYLVLMLGSFSFQWRRGNLSGPVPLWPMVIAILLYVLVPGIIHMDSLHIGLNNNALQDLIVALFLIGSGIYNHLQLTRALRRISQEVRDATAV